MSDIPTVWMSRGEFEALPVVAPGDSLVGVGDAVRFRRKCNTGQWLLYGDPNYAGGAVIEIGQAPRQRVRRCCVYDHDSDGNCHLHESPGVLRPALVPSRNFTRRESGIFLPSSPW